MSVSTVDEARPTTNSMVFIPISVVLTRRDGLKGTRACSLRQKLRLALSIFYGECTYPHVPMYLLCAPYSEFPTRYTYTYVPRYLCTPYYRTVRIRGREGNNCRQKIGWKSWAPHGSRHERPVCQMHHRMRKEAWTHAWSAIGMHAHGCKVQGARRCGARANGVGSDKQTPLPVFVFVWLRLLRYVCTFSLAASWFASASALS